jgi:hypothetical protein
MPREVLDWSGDVGTVVDELYTVTINEVIGYCMKYGINI